MRGRHVALALLFASGAASGEEPAKLAAPSPETTPIPMREHAKTIASYTLRADLDPTAHTVHGEGTITWTNPARIPVQELWFHLYLNAFKNQSSSFMRAPVGGFRGSTVPADWGTIDLKKLVFVDGAERHDLTERVEKKRPGDEDETDARVPLPRAIAPNETITLEMIWDDKLPTVVERTGYDGTFHMVAQWFPKLAKMEPDGTSAHFPFHHLGEFYADFGKYDVTVSAPEAYVIGATGPTVESKIEGGRRIERHVQDDIHDFAWTAWDKYRSRKEVIDGVDVTMLSPPGYDDLAERELETMRFAFPHFGARYGKYPYGVLTLVHPPASAQEAGGMEYPTLITTGQPSWTPRGAYFVEGVTIHEFGHQYFYGLVASNEVAWPFLDEGLNSYAEAEAMTAWKGKASGLALLGFSIGDVEFQAERARHYALDEKVAQPAWAFATGGAYAGLVYSRTAAIMETLARVYGRDAMERALATYTKRFRFGHPVPSDLVATIREVIGDPAADALHAALFDKAWVDYAITQTSSHAVHDPGGLFDRGGKRETVPTGKSTPGSYEGWVLVTRRGTLRFPVEIELVAEDGTRQRVPWDGKDESKRIPYSGTSPLRAATVDPDERILLDQHPDNDFATAWSQSSAGAPRILERASYWAGVILGGLGP